jgi:membrane-bound serine protease (ClpP class)
LAHLRADTEEGASVRSSVKQILFSPSNPLSQKRILSTSVLPKLSQTVKLDLVVFYGRPSRTTSLKAIQNHQAKSLFRKILHLTPSTSGFYRDQAISQPRNPKKTDILPTRYTKKIAAISLTACLILAITLAATPASAQILKITINDTIQPISAEYIARAIDEAHRRNAQAVLIEMNTPGGLVSSTREIIEKISSSPVPVIVYVTPTGGHAGSAGIFILESADVAAMAPGTAAGAAHPVTLIGPVQVKPDDEMNRKIENDAAALMRSFASKRGRNVESAESAVRESKSFTEQEALAGHLIDYVASSPEDLFRQMQGKTFKRFDGRPASLNLTGQPVVPFDMTLKEHILDGLMDPNIAFLILVIGALALYVEFNHPGAVIPGTVGVVFILLAAFALNFLPTRFAALGLILGAFALFAAEAKFASHGVLTVGGIVLLTLGGLLLVDSPIPEMRVHLLTALAISIPFGLITAFLMTIALKARRNKVVTGAQGIVGETGVAQTALSPQGKVFVHGELWDAVASSALPPGQLVVVRKIDGLTLQVDPLGATPPPIIPAPAIL